VHDEPVVTSPGLYTIRIKGRLGATALSAFPTMVSELTDGETVLTGWRVRLGPSMPATAGSTVNQPEAEEVPRERRSGRGIGQSRSVPDGASRRGSIGRRIAKKPPNDPDETDIA